jgi:hypothetical protein
VRSGSLVRSSVLIIAQASRCRSWSSRRKTLPAQRRDFQTGRCRTVS